MKGEIAQLAATKLAKLAEFTKLTILVRKEQVRSVRARRTPSSNSSGRLTTPTRFLSHNNTVGSTHSNTVNYAVGPRAAPRAARADQPQSPANYRGRISGHRHRLSPRAESRSMRPFFFLSSSFPWILFPWILFPWILFPSILFPWILFPLICSPVVWFAPPFPLLARVPRAACVLLPARTMRAAGRCRYRGILCAAGLLAR